MPRARIDADTEFHYEIDDFTDPWVDADWVLLHHAAAGNADRWYSWVPDLAKRFKVLRFDARGHGRSSVPPPGYAWSIEGLANDVKRLLDELDIKKVHFVGASAGGIVAQQFAADHPGYLKSLTLIATKPGMKYRTQDYGQWLRTVHEKGPKALFLEQSAMRFNPEKVDQRLIDWFAEESARTPVPVLATLIPYLGTVDLVPILPRIQAPTLIIAPGDDPIGPIEVHQLLEKHIPNAELSVLEGWNHNISSTAVQECMDLFFGFVNRLPAP